jgi:hypothetical protein
MTGSRQRRSPLDNFSLTAGFPDWRRATQLAGIVDFVLRAGGASRRPVLA